MFAQQIYFKTLFWVTVTRVTWLVTFMKSDVFPQSKYHTIGKYHWFNKIITVTTMCKHVTWNFTTFSQLSCHGNCLLLSMFHILIHGKFKKKIFLGTTSIVFFFGNVSNYSCTMNFRDDLDLITESLFRLVTRPYPN